MPSPLPRPAKLPEAESILAVMRGARDVPNGVRYDVELATSDDRLPAVFVLPSSDVPVPGVLLLHGLGSEKQLMIGTVGEALVRRGIAALAVDLPMHGDRADALGISRLAVRANPIQLVASWRTAADEARLALEYLESSPAVDAQRLGVIGYSLGSFLANIVAGERENVRAVVLAASGDLPDGLAVASLVRTIVDPLRAVRRVAGRPLLMINGRFDRTVKPAQAERLFAAAHEPKTMRWYGGGHWPPQREIEYATEWMETQLRVQNRERAGA